MKSPWIVYLLRCRDGSLYCGVTNDLERRLAMHNSGKGARYMVPSRRPAECVWRRKVSGKPEALRLELWLKRRDTEVRRAIAAGRAIVRHRDAGWILAWRREAR